MGGRGLFEGDYALRKHMDISRTERLGLHVDFEAADDGEAMEHPADRSLWRSGRPDLVGMAGLPALVPWAEHQARAAGGLLGGFAGGAALAGLLAFSRNRLLGLR